MIKYGDLPTIRKCGRQWPQVAGPPVPEGLIHATAHIVDDYKHPVTCHTCGKRVGVRVVKPGSIYAWCLACF